jgi:hypothetical protein
VVNHEKFVLSNTAAWALAPATVFNQDPLANSACTFSGSLSSQSFAVVLVRGVFLCGVLALRGSTLTFVIWRLT